MDAIQLEPVATLRSPWREKFGIPRQSGLASEVECWVELDLPRIPAETLRGLEGVTHLWLITYFHGLGEQGWRPTVRPPRLGGAKRLGVFATRAPHRPNPLGLSLVRLLEIESPGRLRVSGADLLDGTPVLDIKPYLPWAELRPEAECEWAQRAPVALEVEFSAEAEAQLAAHAEPTTLRRVIEGSLRWDPRPAHQRSAPHATRARDYATRLLDVDVRFHIEAHAHVPEADTVVVVGITPLGPDGGCPAPGPETPPARPG